MKTKIGLIVLVLLIGVFMCGNAYAQLVCYSIGAGSEEAYEWFRLQINEQGPLSSPKESAFYHHPIQTVYSVHGKYMYPWESVMAPVTGTIIKGTPPKGGDAVTGAQMSLRVNFVRPGYAPIVLECATEETTQTPDTWSCYYRVEPIKGYEGSDTVPATLMKRVGMNDNCSFFEGPFI